MQCHSCHADIPDDSRFCEHCGASQATTAPAGQDSKNTGLLAGSDGVLRWTYQMNMWRNPTIFITTAKVILLAAAVPVLLVVVLALVESGVRESLNALLVVAPYVFGIMLALLMLAYPLIAILNGGKYCVVFEMDDEGVNHIQMDKQFRKNQVLAFLTVLAGLASGNPQTAGAGLLAGTKRSSYSRFSKVKTIVARPRRHVIHVNESLLRNQIYAPAEFYETIQQHILSRCPKAKVLHR